MKKKEVYTNKKNSCIGIILEEYDRSQKNWVVQHVDFSNGRWVLSFLFDRADPKLIQRFYNKEKEARF